MNYFHDNIVIFRVLEMEATPYDYLLTALGFITAQVNL